MSDVHPVVCCDASVAVYFVADRAAEQIQQLWKSWRVDGAKIVAPSLFRFEVTNAIHRIALQGNATNAQATSLLNAALDLPVHLQDSPSQHVRAIAISRQYGLRAAYDAHYLALAESLACPLYTADAKLFSAVSSGFQNIVLVDV